MKGIKYISPVGIFLLCWFSFSSHGSIIWLPVIVLFIILPIIELFIPPDHSNLNSAETELAKSNKLYDWLLYLIVPLQYFSLCYFLYTFKNDSFTLLETGGRILSMGLLCGIFGINVAHELGHRVKQSEQWLSKALLATSLYMHFFIEHNKGHHKRVATAEDPSSARLNEPVYTFFFRTIIFSYISAWHIANNEQKKKEKHFIHNEMLHAHLLQALLLTLIYLSAGGMLMFYFICSATIGILLLETVNYIEHYGLQRKETSPGKYERAMPWHSWNSDHLIGRAVLFELSRHSDHHYLASKKYQLLEHHNESPQLPTGYPGSMLLTFMPPLWFYIMNNKIKKIQQNLASK